MADHGFAVIENDELLAQSIGAAYYGVIIGVKDFVPVVPLTVGFVGYELNHLRINLKTSCNGQNND